MAFQMVGQGNGCVVKARVPAWVRGAELWFSMLTKSATPSKDYDKGFAELASSRSLGHLSDRGILAALTWMIADL